MHQRLEWSTTSSTSLISRGSTRAHSARARPPVWRRSNLSISTATFTGMPTRSTPAIKRRRQRRLVRLSRSFIGGWYRLCAAAARAGTIAYEDGLEHILLLCSTPVDDETSLFTFVVWRNDDFSVDAEETIAFDRAIGAEQVDAWRAGSGPVAAWEDGHGQCAGGQAIGGVAPSLFCASMSPVSPGSRITRRRLRLLV